MSQAELLSKSLVSAQVNETFTEAVLCLQDETRLCFCHRVEERWAKAVGPDQAESDGGLAEKILAGIQRFRLNAKHLDILFEDDSRWEEPLR